MTKIIFDKIMSLFFLIVGSPLFLLIAILVKRSSPGPIIFTDQRVGHLGKMFTIYKFRSMIDGSGKVYSLVLAGDPRVTRLGRFLRSTHFDELPQLWNVLKGDMSLIGPRPQPLEYTNREKVANSEYVRLLSVRPGLTGPVQIRGRIWEYENREESFRLNLEYVNQCTLLKDFFLLLSTVPALIKRQGI